MHMKRAAWTLLDLPGPDGLGWESKDGTMQIKRLNGFVMPQELIDIMIEEPDETVTYAEEEDPEFEDTYKYFAD
jgi:hypothetical protein